MMVGLARCEADRQAAFAIRRSVFVEEQAIPETEEWDDLDAAAIHLLLRVEGVPAGTARLIAAGPTAKIGRVAVMRDRRGLGLGRALVAAALRLAQERGFRDAVLDAQLSAIGFYEGLGFTAEGPAFDDGSGILHRRMTRSLETADLPANRAS